MLEQSSALQRIKAVSEGYFTELDEFNDYLQDCEGHLRIAHAPSCEIETGEGQLAWNGRRITLADRNLSEHKHHVRYRLRASIESLLSAIADKMEDMAHA